MPSPYLDESELHCSQHHTSGAEDGPLCAIVYDPLEHEIYFQKYEDLNSECTAMVDKVVTNE